MFFQGKGWAYVTKHSILQQDENFLEWEKNQRGEGFFILVEGVEDEHKKGDFCWWEPYLDI